MPHGSERFSDLAHQCEMAKVPAFKRTPPDPAPGHPSLSVLLVRLGELSFSGL